MSSVRRFCDVCAVISDWHDSQADIAVDVVVSGWRMRRTWIRVRVVCVWALWNVDQRFSKDLGVSTVHDDTATRINTHVTMHAALGIMRAWLMKSPRPPAAVASVFAWIKNSHWPETRAERFLSRNNRSMNCEALRRRCETENAPPATQRRSRWAWCYELCDDDDADDGGDEKERTCDSHQSDFRGPASSGRLFDEDGGDRNRNDCARFLGNSVITPFLFAGVCLCERSVTWWFIVTAFRVVLGSCWHGLEVTLQAMLNFCVCSISCVMCILLFLINQWTGDWKML